MYRSVLFETQMKEVTLLGRKIREGLDIRQIMREGNRAWSFRGRARNRLLEIMTRTMNFGRGQVNDELKRQTE